MGVIEAHDAKKHRIFERQLGLKCVPQQWC